MVFPKEPTSYAKTALSDLQGAWTNLREAVVDNFGCPGSDKVLFHIDEAMSWESVRNLERMKATLLLVQNIISQSDSPEEIKECLADVRESPEEVFLAIKEGGKFWVDWKPECSEYSILLDIWDYAGGGSVGKTINPNTFSLHSKVPGELSSFPHSLKGR